MNSKILAISTLILLMVVAAFSVMEGADAETSTTGVAENGTVDDPFIIDSEAELNEFANTYSEQMKNGSTFHFKLNADIDVSNLEWNGNSNGAYVFNYLRGTFDGDGHRIFGDISQSGFYYLINNGYGTFEVSNLVIEVGGHPFSLAASTSGTSALVENVTVERFAYAVNNDVPFILFPGSSQTIFRDCVNNASWEISKYSGVFMAYPVANGITVTFENCVNNGIITGPHVALFVGNDNNQTLATYVIKNSYNSAEGKLIGTETAGLFAQNNNSAIYAGYNSQYEGQCNFGVIRLANLDTSSFNATVDENNLITVSGNSDLGVAYYVIQLTAYGNWLNETSSGTLLFYATGEGVPLGTASGMYNSPFIDFDRAKNSGMNVTESMLTQSGIGYVYGHYVDSSNQYYVFKTTDYDSLSMGSKSKITAMFYDRSGVLIGSKDFTIAGQQTPETVYNAFYVDSEAYSIVTDNGTSLFNSSFEFQVNIADGYIGDPIVEWYPWNSPSERKVIGPVEGKYTINYAGNIVIVISGLQVSNPAIHYNIGDAVLSNMPSSVPYGSSFSTTISVGSGYEITGISVMMGTQVIELTDNTISINSVTDEVYINVFTTPIDDSSGEIIPPGGWDDDDEYVPPIVPVQPEDSSDDTTTIVACAAAAVVAALIAAYLIIDRRQ